VLHWEDETLELCDAAISSALDGTPRLVIIHGGPGSGRTSLLTTATERALAAGPFIHRTSSGVVKGEVPNRGLRDLGVTIDSEAASLLDLERALRETIDDALDSGPLLITIDDLQWLDPESVETLARVIRTAVAERLLVIVTVGYFEPFQHVPWQKLVATSPVVVPIELRPLTMGTATVIAQELRPEIRAALTQRLWEHTQGNPLFFTSLLRRTELADLERMERLPAPDDYARAIEVRLATLGEGAIELARAAAVIGVGWIPLAEAAYVADIADPTAALDVLDREFILEQRMAKLGVEVRVVHAVIQASIYQHIPVADRVRLHARAADVSSDELNELRHRYAAAATYDEELAARLEEAADIQREERSHRVAAMYLDWASRISSDGLLRSRRSMDSFFEWILAGSDDFVRDRLPDIRRARDRTGAALVVGTLDVVDNEWLDAVRVLRPIADSGDNSLRAYRIEILLAWASMGSGESTAAILSPLNRAESMSRRDDALAGLATFTSALIVGRSDQADRVHDQVARLTTRPAAVPLDDTYWLAWQGMGLGFDGRLADAIAPLREVDARMASGFLGVGDGLVRAFLGWCYLLTGSPDLAAPHFRTAEALMRPRPNPMTATIIAGGYSHRGERERAAALFAQTRATLRDMPWPEAVMSLFAAEAAFVHAYGTDAERQDLLASFRADFGGLVDSVELSGPLALPWMALAYLWAGELPLVERVAATLESRADLPWTASAAAWLRGLAAESKGNLSEAEEQLRLAEATASDSIPILSAHAGADRSRVAKSLGDSALATESAARAQAIYARVSAVPYLGTVADEQTSAEPGVSEPALPGAFDSLSERERDVAALVVRGMSYAQIARELFITRSTVGFHLSRIYAKTGTSTRHELSELVGRPQ
jgi:DNA-binding CsgD family transcriptional regulator